MIAFHVIIDSNEQGHFQIVLGGIGTALLVLVVFFIFAVWIGGFFRCVLVLFSLFFAFAFPLSHRSNT